MELTIFILFYLILVILLTIEGAKRTIGGWAIFIISLLLTPVIGVLVLFISQKKNTHFIFHKKPKMQPLRT